MVQPTLQDLHDELQAGGDQVSRYLADALNPYITGSMSGFNGQTNVDLSNRFTVFDVSGLSGELRTFGMMVVIDQVWNRVIRNKANGRRTWLYVDEFHRSSATRLERPVQGPVQACPQVRPRRDRHHAERGGIARRRGREAHAVELGHVDALGADTHRRGRVVRPAAPVGRDSATISRACNRVAAS